MVWIFWRRCRTAVIAVVALLAPVATPAIADPPEGAGLRVARLIRDLGAEKFSNRDQADEKLFELGSQSRGQLEQALLSDDVEVRLRAGKLLERLRLEELWASTPIEYAARGELASKVLIALAAQSGNHVHVGDPYGVFADKKLDRDYSSVSYWEAVDDICGRTGNQIRPHYDMNTPGIVISAGAPGKYPRAYGGPVRAQIVGARRVFIEEVNYEERKAELTHSFQINFQLTWEDRFRVVGYAAQPQLVEAVTDNKIVVSTAQAGGGGWSATTRGLRQVTASMKLNPVPVSAKEFDVFKVTWGLIVIGEPATLELPCVEQGASAAQDDLIVEIEDIEKQPAGKYILSLAILRDLAMPDPQEVVFQEYEFDLRDAEGKAFRLQNQSHSLSDRGLRFKLALVGDTVDSQPKSLKLHYPRLRARRDVELVFRHVPLPVGKPE